ncbi:hypothetical protein ACQ4PT_048072 [Festuca glaucescens]
MACSTRTRRGNNRVAPSVQLVWVFLAVLLLILLSCSPCQGRKLLITAEPAGSKVMHFEGGLVLTVSPSARGKEAVAAPTGFSRAARSMRSVPSPGVGH